MTIPPVVRQVVVSAPCEVAFAAWTERIGQWWPLARHSVYRQDTSVAFVGDQIVETSATGESAVWGRIIASDPPTTLRFTWHPGRGPESASTVAVDFVPITDRQTLVRLTHTGWEIFDEPAAARDDYRNGWPSVLSAYRAAAGSEPSGTGEVWLLLEHRPGVAAQQSVFDHPLFAEHLAFVDGLRQADVLVAAGPLPDEPGGGQTIVRIPATEAVRWVEAAHADAAVAGDLLVLTVRPWDVMVSGGPAATTDGATPGA